MMYRFHDYTLDPASREVRHDTHRLALEPKVFQVLLYLLEHRDRMVPKAELLEQCWPETFVSESALTRCLARLRKAIQPTATAPPVIETRHRQGYRFVAEVMVLAQAALPAPGDTAPSQAAAPAVPLVLPDTPTALAVSSVPLSSGSSALRSVPAAERRQLTVLFCDVVDSTSLAGQLDPEDFRDVMARYHATGTAVLQRYGGHVAQYLGDGLLGYFGWPQAHEDDARRAVHAGLALVTAVCDLGHELVQEYGIRLALRIGIHTGLVVIGTEEGGTPYGQLAVGATPNLAAKMQNLAAPDTVVISAATAQLVQGYFVYESLGEYLLPGTTAPSVLYQIRSASGAHGPLDVTPSPQRTPFVGREAELAVLRDRAAQVRQGLGQAVLLSGDAGIGKSRLVEVVTTTLAADGFTYMACRCSPYAQHTALHPLIEWLQRCIQDDAETPVAERLARLETLVQQAQLNMTPRVCPCWPRSYSSTSLMRATRRCSSPHNSSANAPSTRWWPSSSGSRRGKTALLIVEDLHWMRSHHPGMVGPPAGAGPNGTALDHPDLSTHICVSLEWPDACDPPLAASAGVPAGGADGARAGGRHAASGTARSTSCARPMACRCSSKRSLNLSWPHSGYRAIQARQASASAAPESAIPATLRDALMARLDQLGPAKSTA